MSIIIFIATIILNTAAVGFSVLFIYNNLYDDSEDLKHQVVLPVIKKSLYISLLSALLSSILSSADKVQDALDRASVLYIIIAISWILVFAFCGGIMIYRMYTKREISNNISEAMTLILKLSWKCLIISFVMGWLLHG